MKKYTVGLVFDHRGRTDDGKEGPVEVRVSIERKMYYIGTGIRVTRAQWAGAVVNRPDADALNDRLGFIVQQVRHEVSELDKEGKDIDAAAIRTRVFETPEKRERADAEGLLKWVREQIKTLNVTEGTRRHFEVMEKRLSEFGRLSAWRDLTVERIYEWDAWLHQLTRTQSNADIQAGRPPKPITDASVHNYHKDLKSLLSRAVRIGKIEQNPYDRLRGEFKKKESENTEYLTDEEMKAIVSLHPMEGTQMAMARDLFVFQMYTGLSYSDAQAFDINDYKKVKVENGERWVRVGNRIKTGVSYVSQLLPPVIDVLERHQWQVPKVANAQYNESLKVIQQALGIKTRLHSHLARHTFATWMLRNGVPIEHVSKMVGHTNIRQTQRYAKVMPKAVYDDFEKVNKSFQTQ